MTTERPDLSQVPPNIVQYIEHLETEIDRLRGEGGRPAATFDQSEPPTTVNILTLSKNGLLKRTPRHYYTRQRRGGVGILDMDLAANDMPIALAVAEESQSVLLFSNFGRAFRLQVSDIAESELRGTGSALSSLFNFRPNEQIVTILPEGQGANVVLVSERGWVRRIRGSYLSSNLIPGMSFHDPKDGGYLAAACWTQGNEDLFLATMSGKGVRFSENQVPASGVKGMRVEPGDRIIGVTAVTDNTGVFLLSADGKGTIRLMSGFSANKAPGAGGKIALKTKKLAAAFTIYPEEDIFCVSQQGKIIRFQAQEIPPKEGVVQGVNCMSLRSDEAVAATKSYLA